jgi:hypothetical protein
MPQLPASLTIPGPLIAFALIAVIVLVTAATLVSALRRRSGEGESWGRAFSGAREKQRQQSAQMDELHRAVTHLSAKNPKSDQPNE